MRLNHREADRFQLALDGGDVTDQAIIDLIERSRELTAIGSYAGAARPEFVGALRERLVTEAATLPHAATRHSRRALQATPTRGPMVLVVGRGLPRMVAGLTASLLAVGGIVGAASQSALPGGTLYPVRGFLDGVAVQLAGSEFDRGVTGLSQAREHVSDARELLSRGEDDASLYVDALSAARSSVASAQDALSASFSQTGNVQAPLQMTDFVVLVSPQLEASRADLPGGALGSLAALQAELAEVQVAWTSQLTACAPVCVSGSDAQELLEVLGLQDLAELAPGLSPSSNQVDPVVQPDSSDSLVVPGATVTQPPRTGSGEPAGGSGQAASGPVSGPASATKTTGAGASSPTGGTVVGGGGATVGGGGVVVNGPSVSLPAVPSASVALPSVSVGTGGADLDLPGQSLGGVELPGLGVKVPLAPKRVGSPTGR